jgi:hypothetical protein
LADSAFFLAAMRAAGPKRLTEAQRAAAQTAASRLGRRVVEVYDAREHRAYTTGWADGYAPPTDGDVIALWRLSPVPLITLATCLGLCWSDRAEDPYPGEPTTVEAVLDAVAAIGADRRWALGALRNDLRLGRLVEVRRSEVTLGPAVAAWSDSQVSALRRFSDALPATRPESAS